MPTKFYQTVNCIVCLKPAEFWSGHVLTEDDKVITAGFCKKHIDTHSPDLIDRIGCFGGYYKAYRIK